MCIYIINEYILSTLWGQFADGTEFSNEDLEVTWITLYDDGSALFGTPDATSDLEWYLDEGLFLAYSFASEDLAFSGTWENGLLELTLVDGTRLLLQKIEDFSSDYDPVNTPRRMVRIDRRSWCIAAV